jgi:hypothetical protein
MRPPGDSLWPASVLRPQGLYGYTICSGSGEAWSSGAYTLSKKSSCGIVSDYKGSPVSVQTAWTTGFGFYAAGGARILLVENQVKDSLRNNDCLW